MYKKLLMYFYSGTGNSYRAARWIAETAASHKISAVLEPFNKFNPAALAAADENCLIGLLFPTHGLTAPAAMLRFALSLPAGKGRPCFVIATRAGATFTKSDPGCEGSGTYLIAAILKLKGYSLRGVSAVDMPANWTVVHPAYKQETIDYILERGHQKSQAFAAALINGEKRYTGFIPLLIGVFLFPISMGYILFGKRFLSKLFFTNSRCTGCGLCAGSCPKKAITMIGRTKPRPYWHFSCESCMRCKSFCPAKAIEASHLFMLALMLPLFFPVSARLLEPLHLSVGNSTAESLLSALLLLVTYFIFAYTGHFLIHMATRIRFFNRLFFYTSLTPVFKQYHEPGTTLPSLVGAKDIEVLTAKKQLSL